MRIDSHHHLWEYSAADYPWISDSMSKLKRNFRVEDLRQQSASTDIRGALTVQARQSIQETEWLLEISQSDAFVLGVVGWVPLTSEEVHASLERFREFPKFRAVRHVVQDEPDDNFLLGEAFNRGVSILANFELVYDILIYPRQLEAAVTFVDRHPQQAFVLDHIAKPRVQSKRHDQEWEQGFRELARRDHVSCKFSGIVTEVRDTEWNTDVIRPYWEIALEAFGAERLMFGSDWPVCLARSTYDRWGETVTDLARELSETEQAAFWAGNVARVYQLASPVPDNSDPV